MVKKVEIITLQRVPNYGSVLQAYATQRVIENLGFEAEIINYFPERMHKKAMLRRIKNKNNKFRKSLILRTLARMILLPSYYIRFKVFNNFVNNNLKMTKKEYQTNDELKKNIPNADVYCTGSDQVWNSAWNEGIDEALFLDFVPNSRKCIAYSASFGKRELDEWEKCKTKKLLQKYENISLREKSGVEILNKLGIKDSVQVVDPTLLLSGEDWSKISSNKFKDEKYILVYNLNRNIKIDSYAKKLSKKTGLKVKYLSYQLHEFYKYGKMYCNPSVEDFLALIVNAEVVITDSFHATAFSINFNTDFIIIYPEKFSTRLQSILELTNLQSRVVKDEDDLKVFDKKIEFKKVNQIIENERKKSLKWLEDSLKENQLNKCINIINENDCCGCRACENICSKKAITMIENKEGFLYPQIDKNKCINCGLCKKICPLINKVNKKDFLNENICYSAKNKNIKALENSSSGGMFWVLSKYILDKGGLVVGVEMTKEHIVQHCIIDNENDLIKLMGSKYVSSNTNDVFAKIKKELDKNKLVLFSGVPCQVAGLTNFLMKDYDNLITVDIVCHGVPSQKLFSKYIEYLEDKYKAKLLEYKFRSKKASNWGTFKGLAKFSKDNELISKNINADFDPYYYSFLKGKNYRESCYTCNFASKNRISDITIADFWGIEKTNPEFLDEKGVSAVIINTKKGEKIFDVIKKNIVYADAKYEDICRFNGQLNSPTHRLNERNEWYKNIDEKDFIKKLKTGKNVKSVIKSIVPTNLKLIIKKYIR